MNKLKLYFLFVCQVKNSASVSSSMSPSQGAMTISTTSTMLTELVREDNSTPDDLAVNKWKLHGVHACCLFS